MMRPLSFESRGKSCRGSAGLALQLGIEILLLPLSSYCSSATASALARGEGTRRRAYDDLSATSLPLQEVP